LKAGGFVAASGALGSIWALVTGTGAGASASGTGLKRPRWIKAVSRPTLGETNADYKRFSGLDMFALYRPLKTHREGAGSVEAEQASKNKRLTAWTNEKKPGFSLPDRQLSEGGFTVMHSAKPGAGLLSWSRISVHTPEELGTQRYTASPEEMANTVKTAARFYGAGLVGVARMNEAYFNLQVPHREPQRKDQPQKDAQQRDQHPILQNHDGGHRSAEHSMAQHSGGEHHDAEHRGSEHSTAQHSSGDHHDSEHPSGGEQGKDQQKAAQPPQDKDIVFEDVDVPEVTDAKFVIPRKMKWVVAIAIPMDIELLSRTPTPLGDAATAMGYSHSAFVVSSLAEFIRGLGYEAIPCVNDTAQSIPFAVDAGLGELSRLNKLVTPEFGPAVRLCKVFTDMPMAYDRPIDFGLVEFCKGCKKCAEACPSRALSFDDEPSFKTRGPWNNPGHKAWFEDSYKCYEYWQKSGSSCGVCIASCPYTKGDQALIHEAVKATASIAPPADGVFRVLDDAFGYGKQHNPEQWWTKDPPSSRRG
jgi:reductive dehalogenase